MSKLHGMHRYTISLLQAAIKLPFRILVKNRVGEVVGQQVFQLQWRRNVPSHLWVGTSGGSAMIAGTYLIESSLSYLASIFFLSKAE